MNSGFDRNQKNSRSIDHRREKQQAKNIFQTKELRYNSL